MAGFQANYGQILHEVPAVADPESPQWFAIHVRSRHEKKVAEELQQRGISNFLPIVRQVRRWSDRKKIVELPLFSCYLFVQIVPSPAARVSVLNFHGVLGFIGPHQGTPIPSEQIESIRTLLMNDVHVTAESYIRVGQRVRIRGGALDGVEGVLSGRGNDQKLIVSVDTIQRSISVALEGYEVEPA
jgi:transcription antitermination factor NusG